MKKTLFAAMAVLSAVTLLVPCALMFSGCEVGSGDDVVRTIGAVDFTGYYDADTESSTNFVDPGNSGKRVTSMNLRQTGDQLEANDNNGRIFRGTIGNYDGETASFTLEGYTTAEQPVTLSGTLAKASDTDAKMRGTWIEPGLFANVYGDGTINPSPTNQPGPVTNTVVTLVANPTALGDSGGESTLTASGGSGTYSWTINNPDLGSWSSNPGSGNSGTYQRNSNDGTNSITVVDANDSTKTASVTILQN